MKENEVALILVMIFIVMLTIIGMYHALDLGKRFDVSEYVKNQQIVITKNDGTKYYRNFATVLVDRTGKLYIDSMPIGVLLGGDTHKFNFLMKKQKDIFMEEINGYLLIEI